LLLVIGLKGMRSVFYVTADRIPNSGCHPNSPVKIQSKFVWERFATATKIDRLPLLDVSRRGVIRRSMFISFFY
jgi:hypothetical protein